MEKKEMVAKRKSNLKKLAAVAALAMGSSAFATTTGTNTNAGFEQLFKTLADWMNGSLGKVIALFGFFGTFVVYAMTHRGSVLFIGLIISLIAGGLVGIVQWAFDVGHNTFDGLQQGTTP